MNRLVWMMTRETEKRKTFAVDVQADLELTCEAGTLVVLADGNAVRVRFSTLKTIFEILRTLQGVAGLKSIDLALKRIDLTLYWGDSRFGILGSKGYRSLLLTLIGIQKIIVGTGRLRFAN
jgi:hypothetical protein